MSFQPMSAGTTSALRGACGEDVGENVAPMIYTAFDFDYLLA